MNTIDAILLGAIQGVTEFLPVSSSGHLRLGALLVGIQEPDLLFDIILHVGTLVAVCIVYRDSLFEIIRDLLRALKSPSQALQLPGVRLAFFIVAATFPTAIIGLVLKKFIEGPLLTMPIIGAFLILNGFLLLSSRAAQNRQLQRAQNPTTPDPPDTDPEHKTLLPPPIWNINLPRALLIGIAQGAAALPGISRSGSTITAALLLDVEREQAARYSFLLSIPAILGALVLKFDIALFQSPNLLQTLTPYLIGAASSAIIGYICLILLIKMLKNATFHHFAWYCFLAGTAAIIIGLTSPPSPTPSTNTALPAHNSTHQNGPHQP